MPVRKIAPNAYTWHCLECGAFSALAYSSISGALYVLADHWGTSDCAAHADHRNGSRDA